ncbi:prolyl oligopeptidase family serine peptidase [Erythrobacter sp.]|uniref:alpha/beta hydrolase family protein n=1 Tax=Erythrobacter sp. TaxID=1042 RepID=UPI001425D87F|nr:prolyl oligopeptidase family serine peptidase [Erythrobacter sp.]QIQ85814.1 MAG: S9 family peptidase [Erythrobacter sp.]
MHFPKAALALALLAATGVLPAPFAAAPATAQQAAAVPLEFYGDLPAVEEAVLSPSGTYTALLMTLNGERIITVTDAAGQPVKQFVVGDAKVRGIEWVGEEAILLLRTETGNLPRQYRSAKVEWWRGNVIPLDDRRPVVSIFADQRSIVNGILGFHGIRRVDGRWKGYFGGLRRGPSSGERNMLLDEGRSLFAVDLMTGEAERVAYAAEGSIMRDWLVGPDGEVAATLDIERRTGDWRIEGPDGSTLARGSQPRGDIDLVGLGANGASVIHSEYDEGRGDWARRSVPLTGGEPGAMWEGVAINRYIRDPLTGIVLGVRTTDGDYLVEDEARRARLEKVTDLFKTRRGISFTIAGYDVDLSTMIVSTSGNYDSGTWLRVEADTGERSIVGLERPAIQGRAIGKVSEFTYEASDGLEIRGILTLPPGREPVDLPAIILPHGGPAAHDRLAFDWWAQAFAARGYAVFQPNFRGSNGRGAAFQEAGDGEWGRAMQSDKSDGLKALAEAGIVDPKRACIMGASYGGYAALAGVTIEQGVYRCAVSVNGVSDLKAITLAQRTGTRDIFRRAIDRQFGAATDLEAISPARLADRADAPVLLIHGRDDTVVPFAQSALMADELKDAGKVFEFVELPGEDHWLSAAETRKAMLEAAVRFVERHNPPLAGG